MERKKEFLDNLIRFEVLAAEAKKRGLDQDPEVVRTMKQVMIQKLMKVEFDTRVKPEDVTEEEMKKFYEEHSAEYNKPEEVRVAEARSPGKIVRQGEWFFVPVTPREEQEARLHYNRWGHRLPSSGEPHFAESLSVVRGVRNPNAGWDGLRIYVRGTVHHRDHQTVCFDRWRRVHLNTEVRRRKELARGFYWID
jgi:hypothetical protein